MRRAERVDKWRLCQMTNAEGRRGGVSMRIVATGAGISSDQLNSSLGFPGASRSALDVRAKPITGEMCIAAVTHLPSEQVVIAIGEGAKAALAAYEFLMRT